MCRSATAFILLILVLCASCGRSAKYYLDKANAAAALGKIQDAEVNYRKAIQKDGNNGEAYHQLGLLLLKARKPADAWSAFNRAVELLPNRDDVAVQLADLALSSFRADVHRPKALHDKVTELSDRLLARNAESYDGWRLKGGIAAIDRKFAEAEEFYSHANRIKPLQPELVLGWSEVLLQDHQERQGEDLALQLIGKDKSYGPIYDLLYSYYRKAGRLADAEKILQTRVRSNPADAEGALLLAGHYATGSHEDEMRATLQRMLDDDKDFPRANLHVGDFYARLRRWDDALSQYAKGLQTHPQDKTVYQKRMVDVLLGQGKAGQAEALVDQILKDHSDDEGAREVKASFLLASRKPENITKAMGQLEELVKNNPDDPEHHFNLGRALAARGDLNGAVVQFEAAVSKRPGYVEPRVALIEIGQARGDFKSTLRYADQLLAVNPNLMRVRVARAAALMHIGRELDARRELEALERAYPTDTEVQFQLGILDLHERKLREAEARFRKLTPDDGGDGRALAALVQTLGAENRVDDALTSIRQRLAKAPKSVALQALLARTAAETGHFDEAITEYRQMLAGAPNSEQTLLALGMTYRLKGDYADAITHFEKARALNPRDPEPMVRLGGALALSGRQKEALDHYKQALKLKPEDASLLNNTAYLMVETGSNLDEAAEMAKKALKIDARQPNYTDTLGWIYLKRHLDDSAAQVFRGLTEKYPNNPTFHYHLGMTLLDQGDKKAASSEFKSALARNPSNEVRLRIQSALSKTG